MYIQMLEVKEVINRGRFQTKKERLTATEVLSRARNKTRGRAFRIVITIGTIAFFPVRAASCFATDRDTVVPTPHTIRNSLKKRRVVVLLKTHPSLQHPLPQQHSPFPQQPVNKKVRRGPGSSGSSSAPFGPQQAPPVGQHLWEMVCIY